MVWERKDLASGAFSSLFRAGSQTPAAPNGAKDDGPLTASLVSIGVEPSMKCTGIWRDLAGACKGLFVRYVNLDTDVTPVVNNSLTWDIEQLSVSYVLPLRCSWLPYCKWLQFEYERNTEDVPAGADEVPNDMLFVELFSAF